MTAREQALLEFCQETDESITEYDIVEQDNAYRYSYSTPIGEFTIMTDDEADRAVLEDIENLFDDIGVEMFGNGLSIENFIDEESEESILDCAKEDATSYMEDIAEEKSSFSSDYTRQQEELVEFLSDEREINFNIDDLKEYVEDKENSDYPEEIADFFENYEDNVEDYIEMYAEDYKDEYSDNPIDYFLDHFGKNFVNDRVKDGFISIDFEKVAEEITCVDGRGNILASYDGNEYEQEFEGCSFYIYKQNDTAIEKVADMISNILEENPEQFKDISADDIMELLDDEMITRETLENKEIEEILDCFENDKEITE